MEKFAETTDFSIKCPDQPNPDIKFHMKREQLPSCVNAHELDIENDIFTPGKLIELKVRKKNTDKLLDRSRRIQRKVMENEEAIIKPKKLALVFSKKIANSMHQI